MTAPTRTTPRRWWRRLSQRFDALARRERMLVVAAAVAATAMAADALWLGPALKSWSDAGRQARALPAQRAKADADAQLVAATETVRRRQLEAEIARVRSRLADGDAAMRDVEADLVGPDRMLPLLEQMLSRHGGLRVREMTSLPRTEVAAAPPAAGPAATPPAGATAARPAGAAQPLPALYRHGIELAVEGSYADLVAYLDTLERMPQRLLWGAMRLKVDQHPKVLLTLRVYTLSVDRHWLEI